MTDERLGDRLLPSIRALPKGSGIVFRHYSLPTSERRALFHQVRKIARARRLLLLLAGDARLALAWHAAGWHGKSCGTGIHSAPVHSVRERIAAERGGAALLFVSPIFPTRSHPGALALGRVKFGQIMLNTRRPVIALGGMSAKRTHSLAPFGVHGWAAIDALAQ
jgi:thiamine-phosphate pyrophosphorylase